MYNSTKAKQNSHAIRWCTSHTTFGVSMERVFGVTVGTKGETRGNRDEWRGVGDVTEIEQTWNGKGIVEDDGAEMDLSEIHR